MNPSLRFKHRERRNNWRMFGVARDHARMTSLCERLAIGRNKGVETDWFDPSAGPLVYKPQRKL